MQSKSMLGGREIMLDETTEEQLLELLWSGKSLTENIEK